MEGERFKYLYQLYTSILLVANITTYKFKPKKKKKDLLKDTSRSDMKVTALIAQSK